MFKRILAAALGLALAGPALAQSDWPAQPITLIHPGAAGGGTDAMARTLAEAMSARLDERVIVLAKPGGGTILAANEVAQSAPDGYTLYLAPVSTMAVAPWIRSSVPFDVLTDFTAVAGLSIAPNALVASKTIDVSSMEELLAHAEANSGTLNIGSISTGTTSHLTAIASMSAAGIDATVIPYKGNAEMVLALTQGEIQLAAQDLAGLAGQVKDGAITLLAVSGDARHPDFPDTPTMSELGYEAANLSVWWGIEGPAGLPAEVVATLETTFADVLNDPDVQQFYSNIGAQTDYRNSADYLAYRTDALAKFEPVVAASGVKID